MSSDKPKRREKPFHEPPIHARHWGYQLALPWVWSGVTRFHRTSVRTGLENMPAPKTPTILVCNHQNGLMDPIIHCSFLPQHHIHWLTRSDIFYQKIVRALLFAFNMLPVFRRRDRLSDTRERNQRIFEICVERLRLGAVVGLFPEGNHHGERGLRPLMRGVADMVTLAVNMDPSLLERLQVVPVGLDYEQYDGFQRRLGYRMGKPMDFRQHLSQNGNGKWAIDVAGFARDLAATLQSLMIDIPEQPVKGQDFVPYVGALRTTEREGDEFEAVRDDVQALAKVGHAEEIAEAAAKLRSSGVLEAVRPEDIGRTADERRRGRVLPWVLAPLAIVAGLALWPVLPVLKAQADKRVKDICFKSTFKTTVGMVVLPVFWLVLSVVAALVVGAQTDGWSWTAFGALYAFNVLGTRLAGSWYGLMRDEMGALAAKRFWAEGGEQVRVWSEYVNTIERGIKQGK
jgi:1-acyl-sn-glycerol-3-phosphate acyltransferase